MRKNYFLGFTALLALAACGKQSSSEAGGTVFKQPVLTYPQTAKVSANHDFFGTVVDDPYRWLENPDSAAVREWVEAQNKVTFGYLDSIPFRSKIRARLEKIWNFPRYSAPFREGSHYFYYKNDGLQNQAVLYIQDDLKGEGRVFLDPNTLSQDGTISLSTFSVSQDGKYAVYGTADGGSDWNEFYVRDVETGKDMGDHLQWIKFSGAAWFKNGFFYSRFAAPRKGQELASANENQQVYYHELGKPQSADKLIYEDPAHPTWGIYAGTTEDEHFMLLYLTQGASSNNALYVRDLTVPNAPIQKLITHFDYNYDVIDNIGNTLLIATNDGAPRKRVMLVDLAKPDRANWKEIIPQKAEVLTEVYLAGGVIHAVYLKDASSSIQRFDMTGKALGEVKLPGIGTVSGFSGKKEDKTAFYTFTSFTYPATIFQLNTETATSDVYKKSDVDFDPNAYETKQVFYPSKDGTQIPMFIVHKKGLVLDGTAPTLLYAYGGFNINILPSFSVTNMILLENGGVYAVANLRGGGEYGEDWHQGGMLMKKQNVFDDFIAAAEYLKKEKYTSSDRLAIMGRSNGGLLVGACMAQRPELYKVAFPGVGVMDMLRYHRFTIGHAWAVEYGCADSTEAEFKNLYAYSPLHNLKDGTSYPATMVTTGDHDDRVVPAHSYKFAARLQAAHKGENPVLIRIDTRAGHGAGKPTSMLIDEQADIWSFMFYNMNFSPKY